MSPGASRSSDWGRHPSADITTSRFWAVSRSLFHRANDHPDGGDTVRAMIRAGGRQDHRGPRRPARVLRLPRRALDPSTHDQPDRVDVRDRATADHSHQGPRFKGRRRRDGLQAHRLRTSQVACRERPPTSSHWSGPARCSRKASSSNDPTNQEVSRSRDTPIHRSAIPRQSRRSMERRRLLLAPTLSRNHQSWINE